jgi:hypothetical protein
MQAALISAAATGCGRRCHAGNIARRMRFYAGALGKAGI